MIVLWSLGIPELVLVAVIFAAWAFVAFAGTRVAVKAGYPACLGIAFVVPPLNIALLLFLAFATWPVERELGRFAGNAASSPD
jgi:hypothetical protein